MAFRSRCSCGFVSEAAPLEVDAIDAYRRHERGHAPGQRTGEVEAVQVPAAAPAKAPAKAPAARKAPGPIH